MATMITSIPYLTNEDMLKGTCWDGCAAAGVQGSLVYAITMGKTGSLRDFDGSAYAVGIMFSMPKTNLAEPTSTAPPGKGRENSSKNIVRILTPHPLGGLRGTRHQY